MKSYAGKHFVKIDDVRDGPIEGKIVDITEGQFEKLNLTLDTGDCLSLNKTNTTNLMRAFGPDSDRAIGQRVRLILGEVKYRGSMQEAVLLEPVNTAAFGSPTNGKKPSTDHDDEIPF
jgi:hypothetical protein